MTFEESEDAMYAKYRASIEVPAMWEGVESRLRARRRRWPYAMLAAAAALVLITTLIVTRAPRSTPVNAMAHYDHAIRHIEPRAKTNAALIRDLNNAIAEASREAERAPDDPIAVTRVVAAYEAKLAVLREATYER